MSEQARIGGKMPTFNFLVLELFLVCLLCHKQNINKEFTEQQMEHMEVLLYSLLQKYVGVALVLAMYAV